MLGSEQDDTGKLKWTTRRYPSTQPNLTVFSCVSNASYPQINDHQRQFTVWTYLEPSAMIMYLFCGCYLRQSFNAFFSPGVTDFSDSYGRNTCVSRDQTVWHVTVLTGCFRMLCPENVCFVMCKLVPATTHPRCAPSKKDTNNRVRDIRQHHVWSGKDTSYHQSGTIRCLTWT